MTEAEALVEVGDVLDALYARHEADLARVLRRHRASARTRDDVLGWLAADWQAWRQATLARVAGWLATDDRPTVH